MEKIDFFGNKITLNLNKEEKIKTRIGGCLTILTTILMISFTFIIGIDLIYKEKPITNTFYQNLKKSSNFTLRNNSEHFFGFSLQDFYGTNLNVDGYFDIDVFASKVDFASNITESELKRQIIKYEKCNEKDFIDPKSFQEEADYDYLKTLFCLRYNNLPIAGTWTEDGLDYLTIQVRICKDNPPPLPKWDDPYLGKNPNALNNRKCKPYNEIIRYMIEEEITFNIYYFDTTIKFTDYSNPIKKYLKNKYYYFTPTSLTYIFGVLSNNIISNQDVFFLFEDKSLEYMTFQEDTQITKPLMQDETILLKMEINSTNTQTNHIRRYIEVTEILAAIGGLAKFFSVIFYIINKQFAYFKKCEEIIEKIFSLFREGEYDIKRNTFIPAFSDDIKDIFIKRLSKSAALKTPEINLKEKYTSAFKLFPDFKLDSIKENFDDIDYEIEENKIKNKYSENDLKDTKRDINEDFNKVIIGENDMKNNDDISVDMSMPENLNLKEDSDENVLDYLHEEFSSKNSKDKETAKKGLIENEKEKENQKQKQNIHDINKVIKFKNTKDDDDGYFDSIREEEKEFKEGNEIKDKDKLILKTSEKDERNDEEKDKGKEITPFATIANLDKKEENLINKESDSKSKKLKHSNKSTPNNLKDKSNKKLNFFDDSRKDTKEKLIKDNKEFIIESTSEKEKILKEQFSLAELKDKERRNFSLLSLTFNEKNKPENIKIIKQKIDLRQKELKLKMSIKEIIKYVKQKFQSSKICCFNLKKEPIDVKLKLFQLAEERILEFCDINKMIKLQTNFDNLEKVVLNDRQLSAMKLLQKPVLTSDLRFRRSLNNNETNYVDEIIEYFDEKTKKYEECEMDERIIQLICQ